MNEFSWGAILATVLAFLSGGGGVFILSLLRQRQEEARKDKQQTNDLKLSETEKAFAIYKEIVTSLKSDFTQVAQSYQNLEKQYLETREAKAIVQGKLENAETKIVFLLKEIEELKNKVSK
jgi:chromosome segregation ATPase